MPRKPIDANALTLYDPKYFDLIPLHPYDATKTDPKGRVRKVGKAPRDLSWTVAKYDSRKIAAAAVKTHFNVGVRLKANQLVIDVDPRNGGKEGFDALCNDLFLDPKDWPCVITGSGGWHYYMSKPADIPVRDTLEDYPGVEFKSAGRQVVSAGSRHPDTEKLYKFAPDHPPISKLPKVPDDLLRIIKRPQRDRANVGGGHYTPMQLAKALTGLDPENFNTNEKWLKLMMACHHASNGDARHEFIEWSVLDPKYANDAEIIGRRWDSLHTDRDDGVTYLTLHKFLADAGKANLQVADMGDDFADDDDADTDVNSEDPADWLEGGPLDDDDEDDGVKKESGLPPEAEAQLVALNIEHTAIMDGSKFKIIKLEDDPTMGRKVWVRMSRLDFENNYCHKRIERDKKTAGKGAADTMELGKAWVTWPKRNTAKGALFDPSGKEHPGYKNLWEGFQMQASANGSWDRLKELTFEVLADGNQEAYEYMLNWLAFLFKHPEQQAEVALVMKGGQGVGKSTLGKVTAKVIGRHALQIASPELITGRFNAHLQDVLFLFADEAIRPQDKAAEGRLKAILTESVISFEGKGRDAVTGRNYLHVMLASNESWVVPADSSDGYVRRFFVTECSNKWQGDHERFAKLYAELEANEGSGYKRFLWDMLAHKLPADWHPRKLAHTRALRDQKIRSFSPIQQFCFDACMNGVWPFEVTKGPWDKQPVRVFNELFRESFQAWAHANQHRLHASASAFFQAELSALFPSMRLELREAVGETDLVKPSSDGRARAIEFPQLPVCRAAFDKLLGFGIDWPVVESNPVTADLDFG